MEETNDLVAVRTEKISSLRALNVEPFGNGQPFSPSGSVEEIRNLFKEGEVLKVAGRISAVRDMGKSQFFDLRDVTGRIQIYLNSKEVGPEKWEVFKLMDLGDFMGVTGECFVTRTGEITLKALEFEVFSKCLRPLPDKWHGLADVEARYRQRYLDLVSNEHSRDVLLKRIQIVREIRRFMEDRGFLEVETPMMQSVAGGAAAAPFVTKHNALGLDLYLRIAPELYLKRLLVGGFPKIFEMNRNFRNEGISRRHNPEFTMLEAYWAYADFSTMADMVEELICHLAQTVCGTLILEHRNEEGELTKTIDLTRPWRRGRFQDLIEEIEPGWFALSKEEKLKRCEVIGLDAFEAMEDHEISQHFFEKFIEAKSFNPLFVTHLPTQLVPLAKQNRENPNFVDVYELVINGQEISPGYSELNDPQVQRARLEEQAGEEIQKIDEDFLTALEYGMPPAGGIGIGIDRLVMMLTGAESIRDVIFFPLLRPQ